MLTCKAWLKGCVQKYWYSAFPLQFWFQFKAAFPILLKPNVYIMMQISDDGKFKLSFIKFSEVISKFYFKAFILLLILCKSLIRPKKN